MTNQIISKPLKVFQTNGTKFLAHAILCFRIIIANQVSEVWAIIQSKQEFGNNHLSLQNYHYVFAHTFTHSSMFLIVIFSLDKCLTWFCQLKQLSCHYGVCMAWSKANIDLSVNILYSFVQSNWSICYKVLLKDYKKSIYYLM